MTLEKVKKIIELILVLLSNTANGAYIGVRVVPPGVMALTWYRQLRDTSVPPEIQIYADNHGFHTNATLLVQIADGELRVYDAIPVKTTAGVVTALQDKDSYYAERVSHDVELLAD